MTCNANSKCLPISRASLKEAMEATISPALHLLYSCQLVLTASNDVESNPGPSPNILQGTAMVNTESLQRPQLLYTCSPVHLHNVFTRTPNTSSPVHLQISTHKLLYTFTPIHLHIYTPILMHSSSLHLYSSTPILYTYIRPTVQGMTYLGETIAQLPDDSLASKKEVLQLLHGQIGGEAGGLRGGWDQPWIHCPGKQGGDYSCDEPAGCVAKGMK